MSFGRKGMPPQPTPSAAGSGQPGMSPELAVFLAQERANAPKRPSGIAAIADSMFGAYADDKSLAASLGERMGFKHRGERLMFIAYALWWFCSPTGAHRHYLGRHGSGFAMMGLWFAGFFLTFMSFGPGSAVGPQIVVAAALIVIGLLWFAADAFLIPGMLRECNRQIRETASAD